MATLAAAGAVALSGCGAQEAQTLQTAFQSPIDTATVSMQIDVTSSQGAFKLSLAGPYQNNGKNNLPSGDFQLAVSGATPQAIQAELISTGDDAFIKYGGETYEVGKDEIAKLKRQGDAHSGSGQLSEADITQLLGKIQNWFPQSNTKEDATLNGEAVTEITGKLDLATALSDLKSLADQPGISGAEGLKQLSSGDIQQAQKDVSDPRFTVDVAKSDGKLRRIAASMSLHDGKDTGNLNFSLQFSNVGKPVNITAPSSGKPLSDLAQKIGQDFGGSGGGDSSVS